MTGKMKNAREENREEKWKEVQFWWNVGEETISPVFSALHLNKVVFCNSFNDILSDYITPYCTIT